MIYYNASVLLNTNDNILALYVPVLYYISNYDIIIYLVYDKYILFISSVK